MFKSYKNGVKIGTFKVFWSHHSITVFRRSRRLFYKNFVTGTCTY